MGVAGLHIPGFRCVQSPVFVHILSVWGVSVRSRCEVSRSHCSLWTLANIDYKIKMYISITITIVFFTVRKKKKKSIQNEQLLTIPNMSVI